MDIREFPVLTREDRELIERLGAGLSDDTARVLAYLLLRQQFRDEPATRLAVRVGTSLSRETATAALNELEGQDLITETTIRNRTRGRPPKAWHATVGREVTIQCVYEQHAQSLLEQAYSIATTFGMESRDGSTTDRSSETPSSHPDQLCIGLNWSPNALHAPIFVAQSEGFYTHDGLTVTINQHNGSEYALESVASGLTDVALAGAATILRARATGTTVVPLALLFQRAMTVLYTTRNTFGERFDSTEQLRGRRVGMSDRSETGLLGRLFLSQAGVSDDVTIVNITGEEQTALRSGDVDIVTGSFSDPDRMQAEGFTVDSLLVADQFPIYGLGLVVTEQTLRGRRSLLERFLAGTIAGWAEAIQRPKTAISVIGVDGDDAIEHERRSFERAVAEFGTSSVIDKHGWGYQQISGWQNLRTALDQVDLLTEPVS